MLHEKKHQSYSYEAAIQEFIKLAGQRTLVWEPTCRKNDINVEISRIYREDENECIAFMRLKSPGFRGQRTVPLDVYMTFYLILGKVTFFTNKKPKTLERGHRQNLAPKTPYAIRNMEIDPAIFVFRISSHKRPHLLAIKPTGESNRHVQK